MFRRLAICILVTMLVFIRLSTETAFAQQSSNRIVFIYRTYQQVGEPLPVSHLGIVDPDGSNRIYLEEDEETRFEDVSWSPDHTTILVNNKNGHSLDFYDQEGVLQLRYELGPARGIENPIWIDNTKIAFIGGFPGGSLGSGFSCGGSDSIWQYNLSTGEESYILSPVTSTCTGISNLAISPDGSLLAFSLFPTNPEIDPLLVWFPYDDERESPRSFGDIYLYESGISTYSYDVSPGSLQWASDSRHIVFRGLNSAVVLDITIQVPTIHWLDCGYTPYDDYFVAHRSNLVVCSGFDMDVLHTVDFENNRQDITGLSSEGVAITDGGPFLSRDDEQMLLLLLGQMHVFNREGIEISHFAWLPSDFDSSINASIVELDW